MYKALTTLLSIILLLSITTAVAEVTPGQGEANDQSLGRVSSGDRDPGAVIGSTWWESQHLGSMGRLKWHPYPHGLDVATSPGCPGSLLCVPIIPGSIRLAPRTMGSTWRRHLGGLCADRRHR